MVVRMNKASNMIAKWYQNAFEPAAAEHREHLRHAERQGRAPPVRETIDFSPTLVAASR